MVLIALQDLQIHIIFVLLLVSSNCEDACHTVNEAFTEVQVLNWRVVMGDGGGALTTCLCALSFKKHD